ncbi:MAG TPA: ATP-binding protein, partial [Thermoanaerobaculia bacterium]|nr:ATP-binding protein [Thermoanaerobaculia bacterium]
MDDELLDLVPLFLSEARERVEHLLELAPQVETTQASVVEARREFHTLKGSCRMIKLAPLAELCHQGEELLDVVVASTGARVTAVLDRLSGMLEEVERTYVPSLLTDSLRPVAVPPPERPGASETITAPGSPREEEAEVAELGGGEHRVSARVADALSAGAADLRIRALAGMSLAERVEQLAKLAERGVLEPQPEQVLAMLSSSLRQAASELDVNQRRLLLRAEEQLDTMMTLQLQPLRPFLLSLARHTRELALTLGKEVEVALEGGEARLDRRISAELHGAFVHLVRNAVDHGIEPPELRRARHKPPRGVVRISATGLGDRVEIAVADDGGGIDPAAVVAAARRAGLLRDDVELTPQQALQLVLRAGFSTRQRVSEVSGRGVGLDAVSGAVRRLGGEIWVESTPGQGTQVHVVVPAARRGERVVVLRVGFSRLALARSAVVAIHRLAPDALVERQGQWLAWLGDRLVPALRLSTM